MRQLAAGRDDVVVDDLASAGAAAVRTGVKLVLADPVRFGSDELVDLQVLRFLGAATAELVDLDWRLAGVPPWPVRALVHLLPPSGDHDYARAWRSGHRVGLCTFRLGPGFVRIRDVRPGGPRNRVTVSGVWADGFRALATEPWSWPDERAPELVAALLDAGLAIRVGATPHLLPTRVLRWPIPHTDL